MRRILKEAYLDGGVLFEKYFSMGKAASINRLATFAVASGMTKIQYKNKNKIPRMGVWKAMWRWASLQANKDKAFSIFSDYVHNYGWEWDTDFPWNPGSDVGQSDWNKYMLKMIHSAWQYNYSREQKFLRENGWI